MKGIFRNCADWLLPVFLILFIAEVIAFPIAIGITYAGRSENPDHTLTYRTGSLQWSNVKGISAQGVAELSVFDAEYSNISAENGDALIAPGTQGLNIIRLQNNAPSDIQFKAVVYAIKANEALPVKVSLKDGDFSNTNDYELPDDVDKSKVMRSVAGSVRSNGFVDFDISWLWDYTVNDKQDLIDVDFGNRSANGTADEIKVGFYLMVEDDAGVIHPPKTGDATNIRMYLVLMGISGGMLLLLWITRKREEAADA